MEPLSIIVSVAHTFPLVCKIVKGIADFKRAVSGVDESIQDLQLQVEGLSQVLNVLSKIPQQNHKIPSFAADDGLLDEIVPKMINSCLETLVKVGALVDRLQALGQKYTFRQTWRTVRKQWYQAELDELLARIKTHSMNLQLAGTVLALNNSTYASDTMIAEQSQRFDKLESMLAALDQSMNPSATTETLGKDIYLRQVRRDEHTVSLQACAVAIFSSASTAAGRSSAGATAPMSDTPAFEFIGETTTGVPDGMNGESTVRSEYGQPLDLRKKIWMQDWLCDITVTGAISDTASTIDSSMSHRDTAVSSVLTNPYAHSDGALAHETGIIALDMFRESIEDADDLDLEVARNIFRKAENSLATQDHAHAKALFQEGLAIADNLSVQRQSSLNLGQIRMCYADCCCFFTNDLTSAEYAYEKVMEEQPVDAVTLERILTARHNLSIVKLRQHDTRAAEEHCRQTLNGRRKAQSIGKDHPDYHLTLRLLTVILWAKGAHFQARQYAELLPIEYRPNLEQEMTMLTDSSASVKQWPYSTPSNVAANVQDVCAGFIQVEMSVQGSVDQVHPSQLSGLSHAIDQNSSHDLQQIRQQEVAAIAKPVNAATSTSMAAGPWLPAIEFVHKPDSWPIGSNPSLRFEPILKVLSNGNGSVWVNPESEGRDENVNNDPTIPVAKFPTKLVEDIVFHCFGLNEGGKETRFGWFFNKGPSSENVFLNKNEVWRDMVEIRNGDKLQFGLAYWRPRRFVFEVRLLTCRKVDGVFEKRPMEKDQVQRR